jgi:hypothetical protein
MVRAWSNCSVFDGPASSVGIADLRGVTRSNIEKKTYPNLPFSESPTVCVFQYPMIYHQVLQSVLYPLTFLNQLVAMNQHLLLVAHLLIWYTDARKPFFGQQHKNMCRNPFVGLLLARKACADLRCIPDLPLMSQSFRK